MCTKAQIHTQMHTHTPAVSPSVSFPHLRVAYLIVTNLLIWRDFPPSISLLSCFLPDLLRVGCLASQQLAVCTLPKVKGGRFGWGVGFHQHSLVHNPSCWLLFLLPHPGPGTRQEALCAAVVTPRAWPPWMISTAWQQWFFPSPRSTTLSFLPLQMVDSAMSRYQVTHWWQAAPTFLRNFLFPPHHILLSFRQ